MPDENQPSQLSGTDTQESERVPMRRPFRRGEPCPRCGLSILDYNGMLDLECPACGYSEGGGVGCT